MVHLVSLGSAAIRAIPGRGSIDQPGGVAALPVVRIGEIVPILRGVAGGRPRRAPRAQRVTEEVGNNAHDESSSRGVLATPTMSLRIVGFFSLW